MGSIFLDKAKPPKPKDISAALGAAESLWNDLLEHVREEYAPITEEWKFYKSWHLAPNRKGRRIGYFFVQEGYFSVSLIIGEKATAVARATKLPQKILKAIDEARVYAEGRGINLDCRKASDLAHIKTLIAIKMKTK
ncbi:MAG: DUF3788 family protein [Calditrichota bacterium]